ncbi:MAG TPA: hypothetical protein DCZ20_11400 [Lachnospiraceae bacterium]|nr:hypothetical protein [Lachnospiraceae bacterium]
MWWNKVIFGQESYQVVWWFLTYSILGWCVESIYMSICNRKLTNRGFGKGPFCPIYGVGALTVYFALLPYQDRPLLLFLLGTLLATTLEYATALLMQKIFGEVWWDYTEKPFNYKGILCLESTIAWGFYTLFLFLFLQKGVAAFVRRIPPRLGRVGGSILLFVWIMDFLSSFYDEKKEELPRYAEECRRMIRERMGRW